MWGCWKGGPDVSLCVSLLLTYTGEGGGGGDDSTSSFCSLTVKHILRTDTQTPKKGGEKTRGRENRGRADLILLPFRNDSTNFFFFFYGQRPFPRKKRSRLIYSPFASSSSRGGERETNRSGRWIKAEDAGFFPSRKWKNCIFSHFGFAGRKVESEIKGNNYILPFFPFCGKTDCSVFDGGQSVTLKVPLPHLLLPTFFALFIW